MFAVKPQSWEAKIVATGVADFEGAPPTSTRSRKDQANGSSSSNANQNGDNSVQAKTDDGVNPAALTSSGSNKIVRTNGATDVRGGESSTGQSSNAGGGAMAIEGLLSSSNGDGASKRKRPANDENEIGSDLDDSDEEELDGKLDADGNEDLILCLYDKVQRVRNKWKCVLKDGVASIDGRDYVFSKLASELEW